jgi:hypothetical protein
MSSSPPWIRLSAVRRAASKRPLMSENAVASCCPCITTVWRAFGDVGSAANAAKASK